MFIAYMLVVTLQSGAGELIDPRIHFNLDSCLSELDKMHDVVQSELAVYNIIETKASCRVDIVKKTQQDPRHFQPQAAISPDLNLHSAKLTK